MPNLVNLQSFIRIGCKLIKLWNPKTYEEMILFHGTNIAPPGTHFYVKIGKLRVPICWIASFSMQPTNRLNFQTLANLRGLNFIAFLQSLICYMTRKINNARVIICTAMQVKN